MYRALVLSVALSCGLACPTWAGGLNDPEVVDYVLANPTTGRAALILSADLPVTDTEVEGRLGRKIETYVHFVASGALYQKYPQVKQSTPVRISIVFEHLVPPGVVSRLVATKARLEARGFEVHLRVFDPIRKKSVDLEP